MGAEEHKSGLRARKIVHPLGVQHRTTLEDSALPFRRHCDFVLACFPEYLVIV
jgi:hypothetical protein